MIDTGYLFSRDITRIFINTCLGCTRQCSYCYLSKIGYSNKSVISNIKTAIEEERLFDEMKNFYK